MSSFYKYASVIILLGFLTGCGTAEQTVDVKTPSTTETRLPERPETLADIQALLRDVDESCPLPCFWGFRLGHSTEAQVLEFLQPQAIGNNAPELIYRFPEASGQDSLFYLDFAVQDDLVAAISIVIDNPSEWLPTETLELPHLLSIVPSTPLAYLSISISQGRFFLTLAYDEGVLAKYPFELQVEGNVISRDIDKPFLFCPSLDKNPYIDLDFDDANAHTMLEDRGFSFEISQKVWSVERMTGMGVEEFIQRIIENPEECIEFPSYPDLIEAGYEF